MKKWTPSSMGKKGIKTLKEKNPNHFKEIAAKRFEGKSKEEISEYMKRVRSGGSTKEALDK